MTEKKQIRFRNGIFYCDIYFHAGNSGLTVACGDGVSCEGFFVHEGELSSCVTDYTIFKHFFLEMVSKNLPANVKKLFFGHFGIQVWQPFKFDSAYKLPIGYITEEEKRRCIIGTNQNTIQIFATEDGVTQTITIKDGITVFDDGENGGEFSCQVFTKYFAELAKELPEEVKKLFNGCYGV